MFAAKQLIRLVTVFSLMAAASVVQAQLRPSVNPSSLEGALVDDAADGHLNGFTLWEGALIASGVDDERHLDALQPLWAELTAAVGSQVDAASDAAESAEYVFDFLHHRLLRGTYRESCTEVTELLESGDYNCVSATVLYQCLCRAAGLSPFAVATATHVRTRFASDEVFDVETTCRDWFAIARRDASAQFIRVEVQATRPLTDVQLLGKIFYNRAVTLLEQRQYAAAVQLLQQSLRLDPQDPLAQENLLAGVNNWALAECDAGRYAFAAALVTDGLAADPRYGPFLTNDVHIHQQWAAALCRQHRFEEALKRLDAAFARRPDVALFDAGRFAVCAAWAETLLEEGRDDELWRLVVETQRRFPDRPEAVRGQQQAIRTAIASRLTNRPADGVQLLRQALRRWPDEPWLREQARRLTAEAL